MNQHGQIALKGFAMGMADLVLGSAEAPSPSSQAFTTRS